MIGIFGGSFDPPHIGHKNVILEFWKIFPYAKKLFIIPNRISPFKETKKAEQSEILKMLEIFLDQIDNQKNEICDFELKNLDKSYSIDTIRFLKRKFPKEEIYFLIGEDNLENLHKWKDSDKIIELATLLVFKRKPGLTLKKIKSLEKNLLRKSSKASQKKIILLNNKRIRCSSTEIRSHLKKKKATLGSEIKKFIKLLGGDVFDYIQKKKIYIPEK